VNQVPESNTIVERLQADWPASDLVHGFFGRTGGVSRGPFAALNMSHWVGDESALVDTNWRIARESMPVGAAIASLNQVHGAAVLAVDADYSGERLEADGLATAAPGIVLTVLTADCVPILMADPERGVAAALHAGWRGTLAGIAEEGVRAMVALGAAPRSIRAALGPSIGLCCFEVDEALASRFAERIPSAARHSRTGRIGKAFLDLRGIVRDQLERCGIEPGSISGVGPCTRCARERYFSRRAAGGAVTGLQVSYIGFAGRGTP